ncbi:Glycosyltransferase, catalytic subunit of cellulose synthase and poly-beta-1,6-N-acetylglucosamine synthase [Roseovarius azorensis]|uniref:Glycosyltransferase, catalytic subunit of cellulose synthase and poly-beta-1,6-N-acetylglucosamine synthase n=1 Tax=Roseovarius azorensis TaxID=1287727 RepID=A0A1H7NEG2_9RHOB|nr:glycosyltransferase [Roseovarius azorensis]SEL21966.1 Glycosyltransferase, catalytic subunit of cellulose synthase and poly-beta-1,6-N-acetylglucosamine synthase [Roseovarius azorensis]
MGISELRHLGARNRLEGVQIHRIGRDLVRAGAISASDAARAEMVRQYCDTSVDQILQAEGLASEDDLLRAHARRLSVRRLTCDDLDAAQSYDIGIDPRFLLRHEIIAVKSASGEPELVTGRPENLDALRPILPPGIGRSRPSLASRRAIQDRVAHDHRDLLRDLAETRVPESESCRAWGGSIVRRLRVSLAAMTVIAALSLVFPVVVFTIFVVWACFTLLISAGLKTAAVLAATTDDRATGPKAVELDPLPKVSILVPLFRETEIAHALIARLSRLTYPKCLLDVVLVLEEEDELTRATLAAIDLPPWVRPVVVPDGKPRTKPRAMNYALDFCRGDIIGIFDAEDAPDPDQITVVARRFQQAPRDVACLQGILDYYNPTQNWLARCFTIEYATWFRMILPGMTRLGLAIPLGGTTLYFRRDVLEKLGGWDAHNVTEDADLGFRLARHGYRTEMVSTVTEEEANCRPWPWIKQRSRWLKGYMTTYLVHMRRPRLLFHQLGARKFWGFQAHFVSALSQFLLAPFLWSFWLVILGLPHPLDSVLPRSLMVGVGSLFLMVEVLGLSVYMLAVSGRKHRHLLLWVPSMHFYAPLGAIAAYKALYELVFNPFFWDKTAHGLSVAAGGRRMSDGGFDLSGIKLEPGHEGL